MRNYELTIIVPSDANEEELGGVVTQIQGWVEGTQGKVVNTNHWGRKRLAYNIAEYHEGYYVFMNLEMEPQATFDLERNIKLNEKVIRYLLIRANSK